MSLPPGFLDELRTRLSIGQVVGRKVMWDTRKSNQGKGDLWAPCPFHQEKTSSFHVDDRKGFYYCFGCHAKGDAISFVRETENVGFMEAVEILAGEAGMPMPKRDPRAQEKADERTVLAGVMEQAVQYFRLNLQTAIAGGARDYLAGRGLDADAQARWDIGFAPKGWDGLRDALTAKGAKPDDLLAAGLVKASDKGRAPYDTFRDRIMFPIRDVRGRAIAFGGRAMDPNDNAKYLNSPETPLFDKSRTLFNHKPAREAAGNGHPLIVAEGYMDVIALAEAGFQAAVAPLGTAVTEHHLAMLWRMADEPIIALDGDKAGIRAAMRTIDIALPLLEAGKSLRFAMMPDGLDPDDLLKQKGKGAMQKLLDQAMPMVQLLWQRETEGKAFDSPERKAALDKALREKIKLIQDPSIRTHYGQAIKDMRWALFSTRPPAKRRQQTAWNGKQDPWQRTTQPVASNKASALGTGTAAEDVLREAVILATLIKNPTTFAQFEGELERMDCVDADHSAMRDVLLRHGDQTDLRQAIEAQLGAGPLEKLFGQNHVAIAPAVRRAGDVDVAAMCLAEEFAKLTARRGHAREVADGIEDMDGLADEGVTWRLARAAEAVDTTAPKTGQEDRSEFEYGENGAPMNKDERSALDSLVGGINFAKGGKRPK